MKTKLYISILFCLVAVSSWAQTFKNTYTPSGNAQEYEAFKSPQIMQTSAHEGTVYEPFSTATPSDYSEVSTTSTSEESGRPGHIRKGFDIGGDTPPGPSPIGEPWIMAVMAVVFGGVIYLRRRRATVKR